MSFGKKGLAQRDASPPNGGGFGSLPQGIPGARPAQKINDPMTIKREAFLASERERGGEVAENQAGLTDYARDHRPSYRGAGGGGGVFGPPESRTILIAYLCWFVLGQLSIHRFYLGATDSAMVQVGLLVSGLVTLFIYPPLGMALLIAWVFWIFGDIFLIPKLHRKMRHNMAFDSRIFS